MQEWNVVKRIKYLYQKPRLSYSWIDIEKHKHNLKRNQNFNKHFSCEFPGSHSKKENVIITFSLLWNTVKIIYFEEKAYSSHLRLEDKILFYKSFCRRLITLCFQKSVSPIFLPTWEEIDSLQDENQIFKVLVGLVV